MGSAAVMTVMVLLFPLPVTWRHVRTLRRPSADVPRSDRLVADAVVLLWLLPIVAVWASLPGNTTAVLITILLWVTAPPAVAALRSRRAEQREEDLLRAAQGLPVRRHLASPWQIGFAWAAVAYITMLVVVLASALTTPRSQPGPRDVHLLYIVFIPMLGAVHEMAQYVRRQREAEHAVQADRRAVGLDGVTPRA